MKAHGHVAALNGGEGLGWMEGCGGAKINT
jgi:hypothetical protein